MATMLSWGHDPKHIATLQHDRCNAAFLPDVPFPDTLHLKAILATALAASRNILIVVPSHVFGEVLRQIKPLMRPDARCLGDERSGSRNRTPAAGRCA
jgi:glycerol-3-phosphate dehydrogenase (NAD(P)+)